MKLTVVDSMEDPIFTPKDFSEIDDPSSIDYQQQSDFTGFSGKTIRSIADNTTHLVLHIVDAITESDLEGFDQLEYIGLSYTGWWDEHFDKNALQSRKITVTNAKGYANEAIASYVLAQVKQRRIVEHSHISVIGGNGSIGKSVTRKLEECGYVSDPIGSSTKDENVESSLSRAGMVSLHVPKSAGVVLDAHRFAILKSDALIVNTSGFENIDVDALRKYLETNPSAFYAHAAYPKRDAYLRLNDLPNVELPNTLVANQTPEARQHRKDIVLENLRMYIQGERGKMIRQVI